MTTMNVTQFKTHCLGILERISDVPEDIMLTKRGKIIARISPACDPSEEPWKDLHGTAHFDIKDILSTEDIWEDL